MRRKKFKKTASKLSAGYVPDDEEIVDFGHAPQTESHDDDNDSQTEHASSAPVSNDNSAPMPKKKDIAKGTGYGKSLLIKRANQALANVAQDVQGNMITSLNQASSPSQIKALLDIAEKTVNFKYLFAMLNNPKIPPLVSVNKWRAYVELGLQLFSSRAEGATVVAEHELADIDKFLITAFETQIIRKPVGLATFACPAWLTFSKKSADTVVNPRTVSTLEPRKIAQLLKELPSQREGIYYVIREEFSREQKLYQHADGDDYDKTRFYWATDILIETKKIGFWDTEEFDGIDCYYYERFHEFTPEKVAQIVFMFPELFQEAMDEVFKHVHEIPVAIQTNEKQKSATERALAVMMALAKDSTQKALVYRCMVLNEPFFKKLSRHLLWLPTEFVADFFGEYPNQLKKLIPTLVTVVESGGSQQQKNNAIKLILALTRIPMALAMLQEAPALARCLLVQPPQNPAITPAYQASQSTQAAPVGQEQQVEKVVEDLSVLKL